MALITKQEAADRLTVSVRTLEGMIQRGVLPAYRIGPKLVRIEEAEIQRYLQARLIAPQTAKAKVPVQRLCRYVPGMKVV